MKVLPQLSNKTISAIGYVKWLCNSKQFENLALQNKAGKYVKPHFKVLLAFFYLS